ncbi:glycosyltransferase family 4 protein [Candidatus Woesearchaeota archaeon]|nr:glycosyltransferase family 4 protein [Candidatus Woesearchaeota archaeon]
MKVLMFGWEFPPVSTGGLGTACYGLTKGLCLNGAKITFVLPKFTSENAEYVRIIIADKVLSTMNVIGINSALVPYVSSSGYQQMLQQKVSYGGKTADAQLYGWDLFEEVNRFAQKAKLIAANEDFDVIHCHDWMTFLAGIEAKKASGKKLVVQVHATEFDRTGGHGVNQYVYDIERSGMHFADRIIAVSGFTKNMIVQHYGISPDKVDVVYNAVERTNYMPNTFKISKSDKVVLFLGRVTLQKGPEYFLYAAKKVLQHNKNVKFIMAGNGDMLHKMIELAAHLGIADKVLFTGGVKGNQVDDLYKSADLYVMPSVSEPFGITPLESLRNGTPAIISKTSGVSEILKHALKVDFWDIDELANKILSVLNYRVLHETLSTHGVMEIEKYTWDRSAKEVLNVYQRCF